MRFRSAGIAFIVIFLCGAIYSGIFLEAKGAASRRVADLYNEEIRGRRPRVSVRAAADLDRLRLQSGPVSSFRILTLGMSPGLEVWTALVQVQRGHKQQLEVLEGMPDVRSVTLVESD